jgi:opacity protein-like surface antigen
MNKKCIIFLLLLLFPLAAFSDGFVKIGASAGFYTPSDETFREIYGEADVIYGLRLGVKIWNGFYFMVAGQQYKKFAETTYLGDITRITINPLHFAVRYTMPYGTMNPYLEASYLHVFFVERADFSVAADPDETKSSGGGYGLGAGIEFQLSKRLIVDVGINFSSAIVSPNEVEVNLGGFQGGIAVMILL